MTTHFLSLTQLQFSWYYHRGMAGSHNEEANRAKLELITLG